MDLAKEAKKRHPGIKTIALAASAPADNREVTPLAAFDYCLTTPVDFYEMQRCFEH
jgi:hypothetical protein